LGSVDQDSTHFGIGSRTVTLQVLCKYTYYCLTV